MPIKVCHLNVQHCVRRAVMWGLLAGSLSCGAMVWSQPPVGPPEKSSSVVLTAQIDYAALVPVALFGHWDRTRHIEQSTAREMTGRTETGAWIIRRLDDRILLRNPTSDTETEVTVDSVENDTAVFHFNRQLSNGFWCHEELSLHPENAGAELRGYQLKECYKPAADQPGGFESYYRAVARVKGTRQQHLQPLTERPID